MSLYGNPFTQYVVQISPSLSTERLARYRQAGADDRDIAINYLWNMSLSESLYPSLHVLEISLRNAIHTAATAEFGTEYWFDTARLLRKRQPDDIVKAKLNLARNNKPQTSGRIVAELSLGFWTTLLSSTYELHFWRRNRYAILESAFPHFSSAPRALSLSQRRVYIHQQYNAIRTLRNRVFHFEPIWDYPNLSEQRAKILDAIGWINPVLRDTVRRHDRFEMVLNHGRAEVEQTLDNWLDP
ncbi:MAG TPA: hypothetical protein VHV31_15855 [Nitrolancea sp.]|nr:hypothetical protein [Nitrolancea sp.]